MKTELTIEESARLIELGVDAKLADCDAIFMCEGWQFSRGCRIERTFAEEFGLHVMYEKGKEV